MPRRGKRSPSGGCPDKNDSNSFAFGKILCKEDLHNMNLLVVGGGGREHAIIKKLKENPAVETIYALPGNGGIA